MADVKKFGKNNAFENGNEAFIVIKKVIDFLQLFMPVTLAKRVVAMVLLAAGTPTPRVTELTGLCDRSARGLLKSMQEKDAEELLAIKSGSGQKSKTAGLEAEIIAEIETNNYHTRQQIADMVKEKFHVQISVATVGRFLKKTALKD